MTTGGLHEGEWGDRAAHGGIDGVACAERSLGIGRVAVATRLTRQHGGKLGLAREAAMRATLTALSFGTARAASWAVRELGEGDERMNSGISSDRF